MEEFGHDGYYTNDIVDDTSYPVISRQSSLISVDDRPSQYSPNRRGITDDEYEEYCFGLSGNKNNVRDSHLCKYRQDLVEYQNENRDFALDEEEDREPHRREYTQDLAAYQDEERSYISDDEDARDRQPCKYTYNNVEQSYGSDQEEFDCDSLSTPEYYDQEQHTYLEDLVENNISMTTLALDRAVFDGIRDFPIQLLELTKYFNNTSKSTDVESLSSDSSCTGLSVNEASMMPVSRDPRPNRASIGLQDVTTENNHTQENVVGSVEKEWDSVERARQNNTKVIPHGKGGAVRSVRELRRKKKLGCILCLHFTV
jgi:hypothetical protein